MATKIETDFLLKTAIIDILEDNYETSADEISSKDEIADQIISKVAEFVNENYNPKNQAMEALHKLFELFKKNYFLETFTNIKPGGGFNHRYTGKATNKKQKTNTEITNDEKNKIIEGLKKAIVYLQNLLKELMK